MSAQAAPRETAGDDHRPDLHDGSLPGQRERDAGCRDRAHVELSLGADVEQPDAEGHRSRQAGEAQRRGRRERGRDAPGSVNAASKSRR